MKFIEYFRKEDSRSLSYGYNGFIRFAPLAVTGGFFLFTILLFAFGPLDWGVKNSAKLYLFLFFCLFALVGGYLLASFKGKASTSVPNINTERILLAGVAVSLVLYFPTVYFSTGKWYPDIYTGITNTGEAYRVAKYYADNAPKVIYYFRMTLAPITAIVTPITLFFHSKLSKKAICLGVTTIVLNAFLGIAQGQNKQVADVAMQLVVVLVIMMFSENTKGKRWKHILKMLALILVVCILFFAYYANTMTNRVSHDMAENDPPIENTDKTEEPEKDVNDTMSQYATFSVGSEKQNSIWNKIIPAKLKAPFQYITSYFSHGYYGLSLSLDRDFTSSYGLGFSDFFRHNICRFLGGSDAEKDIYERTYMGKIEDTGWKTGAVWSSFFVFPASDISFPGTVLLVFLIGFGFGLCWKDALCSSNIFALTVFFNFCIMVFYFSANNQVFQMGEPAIGFLSSFALWIITRRFFGKKAVNRQVI